MTLLATIAEWDPKLGFATIGLLAGVATLLLSLRQARRAANQTRADFLFALVPLIQGHDKIHQRLVDEPQWEPNPEEIPEADRYMGALEVLWVLVDKKLIDERVVDRLFGYRIRHIVANDVLRHRLCLNNPDWEDFLVLWARLDKLRAKRGAKAISDKHHPPDLKGLRSRKLRRPP